MQKEPLLGLLLMKIYGTLGNAARDSAGRAREAIGALGVAVVRFAA